MYASRINAVLKAKLRHVKPPSPAAIAPGPVEALAPHPPPIFANWRLVRQHRGSMDVLSRHFPGYASRVLVPGGQLSGLGFSLKPPRWAREAVAKIWQGSKVEVPAVTIPLPGGGSITTPSTKPSVQEQAELLAANIPGGMVTIAAVGLLGAFLLMKSLKR